ncbi:hypothetical protein EPUS_01214 [Endocarpon pusillum Z07020]|uniref:RTA1 domain protein n=1 Tax=Endocarpon pusillum (strain Z07020 / HMAS-L-300199) TaxID=1263415 RepID=U1GTU7_ENDPU|nr:uncharacterized protein EPUS_01214 [Endocarpon pusillum Z07020]ERF75848.1 hypothetical protein EPUS_01214 [Endocarpon pusillum Z07020]
MATPTSSFANLSPSLLANPELCTIDTCPLELASIEYIPTLPGNALYVSLFALCLLVQLYFGIRYRTWGFLAGMIGGLVLEILGYVARIQIHFNPFREDPFLMYIVCLTIGPAFLAASIYLTLSRIITVYSPTLSRFQPRTYTIVFIIFDFFALLLQAAGGGIASAAEDDSLGQIGINIMIAGVSWQVFSLGLFAVVCLEFAWRVRKAREEDLNQQVEFVDLRRTTRFKVFLWVLAGATLAIFVRCVFRCAELSEGFDGRLANDEVTLMVLEGAMIVIAVMLLTALHPGPAFGGMWANATWSLRGAKKRRVVVEKHSA